MRVYQLFCLENCNSKAGHSGSQCLPMLHNVQVVEECLHGLQLSRELPHVKHRFLLKISRILSWSLTKLVQSWERWSCAQNTQHPRPKLELCDDFSV